MWDFYKVLFILENKREHHLFTFPMFAASAQFQAYEEFGDRRDKVVSARTYFYEDEKHCDQNMEIFLNCIDAVSCELKDCPHITPP